MKNILITGCAGFIGFSLSKYLLDKKINIIGIDNVNNYYNTSLKKERLGHLQKYKSFKFIKGDISSKTTFNRIKSNNIDLVAMAYSAAGPFPQTYYDKEVNKDALLEAANNRKNLCFEIYLRYAESFPSTYRLPFAGDYILGGKLTGLNEYRGAADAFEVTKFDSKALVFNAGGFVDLLNNQIDGLRKSMHSSNELAKRLKEIHKNKLDFLKKNSIKKTVVVVNY